MPTSPITTLLSCPSFKIEMSEERKAENSGSSSALKNFIAGGAGGVCLVVAGHPLDTIKVVFYFTHFAICVML